MTDEPRPWRPSAPVLNSGQSLRIDPAELAPCTTCKGRLTPDGRPCTHCTKEA